MTTHSSVLAWRISGTGEPGGLPSLGSHRVGHDWSDLAAAAAAGIASTWLHIAQGYLSELCVSGEMVQLEAFPKGADIVRTSISTTWEKIFCLCSPCYLGKNTPGNLYCNKGWVFWYDALDYCLELHWKFLLELHWKSFSRLSLPRIHFMQIKN